MITAVSAAPEDVTPLKSFEIGHNHGTALLSFEIAANDNSILVKAPASREGWSDWIWHDEDDGVAQLDELIEALQGIRAALRPRSEARVS